MPIYEVVVAGFAEVEGLTERFLPKWGETDFSVYERPTASADWVAFTGISFSEARQRGIVPFLCNFLAADSPAPNAVMSLGADKAAILMAAHWALGTDYRSLIRSSSWVGQVRPHRSDDGGTPGNTPQAGAGGGASDSFQIPAMAAREGLGSFSRRGAD